MGQFGGTDALIPEANDYPDDAEVRGLLTANPASHSGVTSGSNPGAEEHGSSTANIASQLVLPPVRPQRDWKPPQYLADYT